MRGIILVAVALAALLIGQFLYYLVMFRGQHRQHELKRRLQMLAEPQARGETVLKERHIAKHRWLQHLLEPVPGVKSLERLLEQTDLALTVAQVLGLCAIGAAVLGVGLWLVLPNLPFAVLGGLIGATIPVVVVVNARARRSLKLSAQMPDALEMMVRSLRAGHGLNAAMRLVAQEMPLPVAMEFGRCFEEQRLGVDTKDAVRNMAARVPDNTDLKIFAVSVIIQHDTGGNLVEILEQIGTTIRDRFKFYGKLRALTVEAKLSAIILATLPLFCLVLVVLLRPSYLVPLAKDPIGQAMVVGGLALWIVGAITMKRMAQVDY